MEFVGRRSGRTLPAQALAFRLEHLKRSPALSVFLSADLRAIDHGVDVEACESEQHGSPTHVEPCADQHFAPWRLAFEAVGCRELQRKLEVADDALRSAMAEELRGRVCIAAMSPHANYVLQKCIEVLHPASFQFIIDELLSDCILSSARHKFGCRVVMRLLEHGLPGQVYALAEALMPGISELARNGYGNYVVQHMIKYCTHEQRCSVMDALQKNIALICKDLYGSSVVRTVLASSESIASSCLATAILMSEGLVHDLAKSHRGQAILKLMVKLDIPQSQGLLEKLTTTESSGASRHAKGGRKRVGPNEAVQLVPVACLALA